MPPPPVAMAADLFPPEHAPVMEEAKVEMPVAKPIEVIATLPGYYKRMRKAEGDKFIIKNMSELGSWMKLSDQKAEAERQKAMKEKKLAGK